MTFAGYLWGIIAHPVRTLDCFRLDWKRIRYSFFAVIIFAGLYSLGSLIGYLQGVPPYGWQPFLRIPIEQFFLWQSIYLIPITIITWVFYGGCVQLVARPFGGKGSFEDTFALLGLPLFALLPAMQIPDAIISLLPKAIFYSPVFYNILNPIRLVAGSLWIVALHILAVQKAQYLPTARAIPVTLLSFIPYYALVITYVH